ncbi:MAG: indole-3-glycerol phosphate synthase TrpC [Dehalococcoidia bacterium]
MNILDKIVNQIKIDLLEQKNKYPFEMMNKEIDYDYKSQSLRKSLNQDGLSIIAEIKDTSPSKGKLMQNIDFISLAKQYFEADVSGISVVTEKNFFNGSINSISKLKSIDEYNLTPVLRKDFIIDEYQIFQSKLIKADAILLIASILDETQLKKFISLADELNLDYIVEIHNEDELDKVLKINPKIIGINNRNLNNFQVDINTTLNLIDKIPNSIITISESGIYNSTDMQKLYDKGCNGVLIGESIITSENPYEKIIELKI